MGSDVTTISQDMETDFNREPGTSASAILPAPNHLGWTPDWCWSSNSAPQWTPTSFDAPVCGCWIAPTAAWSSHLPTIPNLAAFHERLDALQQGVPEGQKHESYAAFFDAIDGLRPLEASDRITPELQMAIDAEPGLTMRLDVECWHPGDRDIALEWLAEVSAVIHDLGGRVADRLVHDGVGLLLVRAYLDSDRISDLAELDTVARVDVLPFPILSLPELFQSADELPRVELPDRDAPIVGVVDSGVASAHPLLAGAVLMADGVGTGIDDGEDQHGHGTMVAALILHGEVDMALSRGLALAPLCQIVSARVLDRDSNFPDEDLWERDLIEAIEWCANQGATIINLSIGDGRTPFRPPRQLSAAAVVDEIVRRRGLVMVISTGNVSPGDYLTDFDEQSAVTYPVALLAFRACRDPRPRNVDACTHHWWDDYCSGCHGPQQPRVLDPPSDGQPGMAVTIHPTGPRPGWCRQAGARSSCWHARD